MHLPALISGTPHRRYQAHHASELAAHAVLGTTRAVPETRSQNRAFTREGGNYSGRASLAFGPIVIADSRLQSASVNGSVRLRMIAVSFEGARFDTNTYTSPWPPSDVTLISRTNAEPAVSATLVAP